MAKSKHNDDSGIGRIMHQLNEVRRMEQEAKAQGEAGMAFGPFVHKDPRVNDLFVGDFNAGQNKRDAIQGDSGSTAGTLTGGYGPSWPSGGPGTNNSTTRILSSRPRKKPNIVVLMLFYSIYAIPPIILSIATLNGRWQSFQSLLGFIGSAILLLLFSGILWGYVANLIVAGLAFITGYDW